MKKIKEVGLLVLQTFCLVLVTMLAVVPVSCRMTEEGISVYDGDYKAPVIESIEVLDEKTVQMNFSEGVKVGTVVVSKMRKDFSDSMEHSTTRTSSDAIQAASTVISTVSDQTKADSGVIDEKETTASDSTISVAEKTSETEKSKEDSEKTSSDSKKDNDKSEETVNTDVKNSESKNTESKKTETKTTKTEIKTETQKTDENNTETNNTEVTEKKEPNRIEAQTEVSEDGCTVTYTMEEECEVGEAYEIFGTVEDATGNTLTFCVPFTGYNSRVPDLIFTEVQIKYAKGSEKGKTVYRGEFVELLALSDGNLGGLELAGGADGEGKKYVFPAVEVTQGEIILVHLRTVGEGCVDETGEKLDEATAPYSVNGVRDLWSSNTTARFNDDSDVILLRNSVTKTVLDAFMYAVEDAVEWKKGPAALAKEAVNAGIYESDSMTLAAENNKTTAKKSFRRTDAEEIITEILEGKDYEYPVKQSGENWEVTGTSPGIL